MEIESEIEFLRIHLQWLDGELKKSIPVDASNYQSIGCFDLTIEHFGAILLLASADLYGSMFSMIRVTFESLGRGLWLRYCATPSQRIKFSKGKLAPTFGDMLLQVEAAVGTNGTPLSSFKDGAWAVLNDFTHTGIRQVRARHKDGAIGGTYKPEQIIAALRVSGLWALFAGNELASYAQDEALIAEIKVRANELSRRQLK